MSRPLILGAVAAALALTLTLWLTSGTDGGWISTYAADQQRGFQNSIARTLRALRGGDGVALVALLAACFAYGFFHAIGPGHGKILIGGYGASRDIPRLRLTLVTLAASLGQAVTAIMLAFGGLWALRLTREQMIGAAEQTMAPLSYGAITLIGLWLVWRGLRKLHKQSQQRDSIAHPHDCDHECCGHRHGPTAEELKRSSISETLAVILGIAIRPCTGALFVLIITWQMGIPWAGAAGAIAMAIGTACVTLAVGLGASLLRGSALMQLTNSATAALAGPLLEVTAGTVVVTLASVLLSNSL